MTDVKEIWSAVKDGLRELLSAITVDTWFEGIEAVEQSGDTLYLYCESGFRVMIIQQRYAAKIQQCLAALPGAPAKAAFLTDAQYREKRGEEHARRAQGRTFETFLVGSSNRIAYMAARAVAEQGGRYCNPLVIHGNSGLGKSHLLNAIACEALDRNPKAGVALVQGDGFTNELIDAIRGGTTARFRDKYRKADFFLMDDVQFIAGKKQTQEEFFNTFEALYEAGSRIVITLDRPPQTVELLEKKLLNRFEGGLIVEVSAPEYSLREQLVRTKAEQRELRLSDDEVTYIVENLTDNVRQIEGLLNQIKAHAGLPAGQDTAMGLVKLLTDRMAGERETLAAPEQILERLCAKLGVEKERIRGKSQEKNLVTARQMIMYVLDKGCGCSASGIGRLLHRNHSTVTYGVQSMEKKAKADPKTAALLQALMEPYG